MSEMMFSNKENQIINMVLTGCSNKQISQLLEIKEKTVKWHLTSVYKKAGVKTRSQLIIKILNKGIVNVS